jgi:hypothetical protein
MGLGKIDYFGEILRLLSEQNDALRHWPYSNEQVIRDKEISAHIRELIDRSCAQRTMAKDAPEGDPLHFESSANSNIDATANRSLVRRQHSSVS